MRKGLLIFSLFIFIFFLPAAGQFNKLTKLVKRGDFDKALQFAEKRMAKLDERKFKKYKLQSYHLTLGKVYYTLGDYGQAEKEFNSSLAFVNARVAAHKRLKLPDFDVMDELAFFYVNTGNFQQAREFIDRSLKLRVRKLNKRNPTNYRPYLPLGMLHFYQDHFDSARHFLSVYQKQIRNSNYTGFLDINRYADTYQVLSEIEMKTAHWDKAKKFARKSVRLQRHPWTKRQTGKNYIGRVKAINTLSTAYRIKGNLKRAGAYNKKALSLYRRKYKRENYALVPVYLNKAWISVEKNNIDTARLYLSKTIRLQMEFIDNNFNHLSEYEKENYYARLRESFHEINSMMLKLYKENKVKESDPFWSEILNYIINTKALILSETNRMVENMRKSQDPELRKLFAQWRSLKNEWAYLSSSSRKKNKAELNRVQNEIITTEKAMTAKALPVNKERSAHTNWQEVKSRLGKNEAAIELSRVVTNSVNNESDIVYLAFVISNTSTYPQIVLLPEGKLLESRYIKNYFNSVNHRLEDTISYRVFWKPLVTALPGIKTIYISSDGVFHLINADIIRDISTNKFLTDEISIVNMTNIGHLILQNRDRFSFTSAGLFGSPDFSGYSLNEKTDIGFSEDISPLPGTEAEVKEINTLLRSSKIDAKAFMKGNATEQQLFDLQGFDVLHLATHGFYNSTAYGSDAMLGSGLVLAKGSSTDKDGILTAYEASLLNLDPTKLVILSACKTGLGAVKEGEGVYGLQRAFEVAGVDHIMMTLWNVDDAVTKEFMVDFYNQLIQEKNVQSAFKKAQLKLKEKYPDVYYWGAFKLISSF